MLCMGIRGMNQNDRLDFNKKTLFIFSINENERSKTKHVVYALMYGAGKGVHANFVWWVLLM